jgi:hypothetical protein
VPRPLLLHIVVDDQRKAESGRARCRCVVLVGPLASSGCAGSPNVDAQRPASCFASPNTRRRRCRCSSPYVQCGPDRTASPPRSSACCVPSWRRRRAPRQLCIGTRLGQERRTVRGAAAACGHAPRCSRGDARRAERAAAACGLELQWCRAGVRR